MGTDVSSWVALKTCYPFLGTKITSNPKLAKEVPLQAHINWHYSTIGMTKKDERGEVKIII